MSNAFIRNRNKVLFETLMNPKFHKEKKNFVLNESEPGERAFRAGAEMAGIPKSAYQYDNFPIGSSDTLLDIVNVALDVIGIFDPSGIADLSNMMIYISRGKYIDAFFSLIGAALPYVGDALKASKVVSSALLKDVLKKLVQSPAGFAALKKILAWATSKGGKAEKFADWVASFIFKNDLDLITHSVLGKETKEVAQDIVNKKMIETTTAWSLQGQKALFRAYPKSKIMELLLAGGVIAIDIYGIYKQNCSKLLKQTEVLKIELSKNLKQTPEITFTTKNGQRKTIVSGDFITAFQFMYILEVTNRDPTLIGSVLYEMGTTTSQLNSYLVSAEELEIINESESQNIIESFEVFNKRTSDSILLSALGSIGQYLQNIIPEFISNAEKEHSEAMAKINYLKNLYLVNPENAMSLASKYSDIENAKIRQSVPNKKK